MNEQRVELEVTEGKGRLDKYLAENLPDISRSAAQRLIEKGQVTVNGDPVRASHKIKPGDLIVLLRPSDQPVELVAEAIPLDIVYEDDALLVVNKEAGMVVHPAPGHPGGTLLNALLAYCPQLGTGGDDRQGIVHRLDRDTSGLILVAKSVKARRVLQQQFKDRTVHKVYLALLDGHLQPAWGRIEAPVGRDPQHRQRMTVLAGGRESLTEYHVIEQFDQQVGPAAGAYTLAHAEPKTGRTHQIRVHFASIGHPVAGDAIYGRRRSSLPLGRQFLHASRLEFRHPIAKQRMELEAPPPQDLVDVLELLRG
jgi:23S rRNA pseudouridine1911/1915/1917 synthase